MRVKNISKKIIGNQSFRLLPGETMEVQGDEIWVKDYMAEKKLEVIDPETKDAVEGNESRADNNEGQGPTPDESRGDEAKTTDRGRKK